MGVNRLFLSIFLIGSSLIFGIFVALPRFQEFSAVQKELSVKQAELESRDRYFAHLKYLQNRVNAQQALVAKIDAALPNDSQLPGLYEFLQSLAAGSGLSLRSIAVSQNSSGQGARVQRTSASLQLGGSYEDLKVFLSNVLRASRMTDVEAISFSSPQTGTGFVFTIRTNSYSY